MQRELLAGPDAHLAGITFDSLGRTGRPHPEIRVARQGALGHHRGAGTARSGGRGPRTGRGCGVAARRGADRRHAGRRRGAQEGTALQALTRHLCSRLCHNGQITPTIPPARPCHRPVHACHGRRKGLVSAGCMTAACGRIGAGGWHPGYPRRYPGPPSAWQAEGPGRRSARAGPGILGAGMTTGISVLRRLRLTLAATALITVPSGCGILGGGGGGSDSTAAGTASGTAAAVASSRPAAASRTPAPAAACRPDAVLSTWSLNRRAAQLVVVPVEEDAVLSVKSLVADGAGGIILFGSEAPATMPADLAVLRRAGGRVPPLVMVDEEGGEIQRMANLAGDMPWPRTMAATLTRARTRALAEQAGRRIRADGVTMDLAPVLD